MGGFEHCPLWQCANRTGSLLAAVPCFLFKRQWILSSNSAPPKPRCCGAVVSNSARFTGRGPPPGEEHGIRQRPEVVLTIMSWKAESSNTIQDQSGVTNAFETLMLSKGTLDHFQGALLNVQVLSVRTTQPNLSSFLA